MRGKRRLLFVVNDAPFFVSHRLPIAVAARDAGFDVHVALPRGDGLGALVGEGLTIHPIPLDRSSIRLRTEVATFVALIRLYRRIRPDLVHHVTVKPVLYGSLAARLTRVPAVVNAVSGLGYVFLARDRHARLRRAGVMTVYRQAFRHRCLRTIFQNTEDEAAFLERGLLRPDQSVLIRGSGVDLATFHAQEQPDGLPIVMLPARMLWDKGVGEFVAAARLVRQAGVSARFVLVGDTDVNRASVGTSELRAWHEEGIVEWWGRRDDMPATLAAASIVCLPSYREGLPKVLLEAAACERAIVTTDVPGCRDAVIDGQTGLIVPARDAAALAAAITRLLHDGPLRHRLARAARGRASREFGIEQVVATTLDVYRELLG